MPCNFDTYFWDILHLSEPSMGEIGKQRQSNEMERYGALQDLSFYKLDFEILVQALYNERDQDFLKFGLKELK